MIGSEKKRRGRLAGLALGTLLTLLAFAAPVRASTVAPFAYVADSATTVSVLNTSTNAVVATVDVPFSTNFRKDVVVSPSGDMVYVSGFGITAIDTATNTVAWSIDSVFQEGGIHGEADTLPDLVSGLSISPNGQRLYATLQIDDAVAAINTATHRMIWAMPVGNCPSDAAVSSDNSRVYVTNTCDDSISVLDTATKGTVATIATGNGPSHVAVNPKGGRAYVTGSKSGVIINTGTNTVSGGLSGVTYPADLAVTSDGNTVYAFGGPPPPDFEDAEELGVPLSEINASTGLFRSVMFMKLQRPRDVALTPDDQFAYIVDLESDNVTVLNTATRRVVGSVEAGDSPAALAITPSIEGLEYAPQEPDKGSGGDGSSTPPATFPPSSSPSSPSATIKKPLKCRKGFKKRKMRGKTRCVKTKKRRQQQSRHGSQTQGKGKVSR